MGKVPPFRPFFLLASLDAIFGAGVWLPVALDLSPTAGPFAGAWHRNALLFGTIPAILAGFLLTALPRWTRRPAVSPVTLRLLAALWLTGRAASLLSIPAGLAVSAAFVLSITVIAAGSVIAARDRRNFKIALLLLCFCGSAALTARTLQADFALRMAIASIIGLIAIIGGRVIPALTESFAQSIGRRFAVRRSVRLERAAGITATCALAAWAVAPQSRVTGLACVAAACAHTMRLAQWHGWRARLPGSIIALHMGYCWTVIGFVLLAFHAFAPESVGRAAGIHAWTIGAVGTMGLAIMASMIRKHSRRPFSGSMPATAAFISITLSCLSRLLAETFVADIELWTTLSAALWILSFSLFLAAFGRYLLLRP
ncbi:NnrS family protein [Mesorhizobium sp.]|uniref:NnrS family protein n=1 Tax=Mesorhizobium sp. TaxID=1871066 RepID=UPI00257CFF35|nr:NnrS family protein [Mesorhizobium sp.]